MRLTRVDIRELFGLFNYRIDLKISERITIIHGPNGCGKTTVLSLLYDLFEGSLTRAATTQFNELSAFFDDGSVFRAKRELGEEPLFPHEDNESKKSDFRFRWSSPSLTGIAARNIA